MSNLVAVSEAVSLGAHTMALLAKLSDGRSTNQEIARALGASWHHLAKVMRQLVRAGLVHSIRGPGGGFSLARPAAEITLMEVVEAIEGPLEAAPCLAKHPVCQGSDCLLGQAIRSTQEQLRELLCQTSVADAAETMCLPVPSRG